MVSEPGYKMTYLSLEQVEEVKTLMKAIRDELNEFRKAIQFSFSSLKTIEPMANQSHEIHQIDSLEIQEDVVKSEQPVVVQKHEKQTIELLSFETHKISVDGGSKLESCNELMLVPIFPETLEYISKEYEGRVELPKAYYKGLSKSLSKKIKGTGIISGIQQCNDFIFLETKEIAMGRVGDDFWFQDSNGNPMGVFWLQGVHMIHYAYNSLWMGQIIQPDLDMFQSNHVWAKYHAGSKAICGGPVYLSDSLGCHNFEVIKKLVYLDGIIPKCQRYALPTRDCLFINPWFDKKSILKLWNFNKYGDVIGAFNYQEATWESTTLLQNQFPPLELEDKLTLQGVGIDKVI
ncbi:hypothetical protein PTKIN_Ptkin01aG0153600 [Pterospermum kingtungense]